MVTLMCILGCHLLHIQVSTVVTVIGFSLSLIVLTSQISWWSDFPKPDLVQLSGVMASSGAL